MNKLKKILLAIKLVYKKPSLINLIIGSDEKWDGYLLKKHPKKTKLSIVALEDLIPDFNKTLTPSAPLETIFRTGLTFRVRVDGAPTEA